jgi:D-amino peptidase
MDLQSRFALTTVTLLVALSPSPLAGQSEGPSSDGISIYISADLEGVTGAVTSEQLGPGGFEYERFRRFMTEEVLAAIEGARAAGAGEILVSDSHGNGQNLVLEMLPDDIKVVRSWPRELTMMHGLDESFDGAIFIGYHAGTTNLEGVRAHTMSSASLTDIRINDYSSTETIWNAAGAGTMGVPVIAISGDDATIAEARATLGDDFEGAVVKWAHSFHSATTVTPARGQQLIRAAVEKAVQNLAAMEPYKVSTPVRITVRFKHYQPSMMLAYLPWFERVDAHAIEYDADDMIAAASILTFLRNYSPDVTP